MEPLSHPAGSPSVHSSIHTYTQTHSYTSECTKTQQSIATVQLGPAAVTLFTVKIWGIRSPCILPFKAPLSKNVHRQLKRVTVGQEELLRRCEKLFQLSRIHPSHGVISTFQAPKATKSLTWAAVTLSHSVSWVAAGTFLLECNEAICSCQIIAAQHPGPFLPIYISQQAEPTTPIEPSGRNLREEN